MGVDVRFGRALVIVWMLPVAFALVALVSARRSKPSTRRAVHGFVKVLAAAYLFAIVAITLWPYEFDFETGRILARGNWVPFGGTLGFLISENSLKVQVASRDFLANVLLFAPLGFLLAVRARRSTTVLAIVVGLSAIAFVLEVVQGLTVAQRTLDIDDALAGSVGAAVASLLGMLLRPLAAARPRKVT